MNENTHILIVEDEKQIARFLQMELEHEGYICSIEYNGAAALDRIGQEHFDLILLDIMLPDVDGLTYLEDAQGVQPGDMIPVRIAQGFAYDLVAERID